MSKEAVFAAVRSEIECSKIDLGNPTEFGQLIEIGATAVGQADTPEPEMLRVWTAMALLGPHIGLPDDDLCDTLVRVTQQYCPENDLEACLDLAAAFGCGWGGNWNGNGHDGGWRTTWSGAFVYLTKRAEHICRRTLSALNKKLHVNLPKDYESESLLLETARLVTTMLVQPVAPIETSDTFMIAAGSEDQEPIYARLSVTTNGSWEETIPTGARAVYQCTKGAARDDAHGIGFGIGDIIRLLSSETLSTLRIRSDADPNRNTLKRPTGGQRYEFTGHASLDTFACTCGEVECAQRHRLSAWNPGEKHGELQNFLYTAIRGKMQTLKAKDFAQGLLGTYWARHGLVDGSRLRLAEVIHRACTQADCREPDALQPIRIYWGDQCDRCGSVATQSTPRVSRERLIFVDTERPQWEFREFWRCPQENCSTGQLDAGRHTLLEPTPEVLRKALMCGSCEKDFWAEEHRATIAGVLGEADTLLQAVRNLEAMRRNEVCSSCGEAGTTSIYCSVCEKNERPGQLPARPTWYFVHARREG